VLIRLTTWEAIREQFTDDEKDALNAVATGETICPRGLVIDEDKLAPELRDKLLRAMIAVTTDAGLRRKLPEDQEVK
jgi:ABC-type phosphate/phosphonate transport system substrate-binding protein